MGARSDFYRFAIVSILLGAGGFAAQPAAAQGSPCSVEPGRDHSGETPLFTGIDQSNRPFTLTRNQETGAWSLWVITEFTQAEGGLEVGKPCVVLAGDESQLITAGEEAPAAVAAAEAPDASDEPAAEMFRVVSVESGAVLDLRSGPGTDHASLVGIPHSGDGIAVGACRTVDGYRFPWCEVTWQGTEGWASACCLEGERTGRRLD